MELVYVMQEPRNPGLPSIFLAGPTPRRYSLTPTWRPAAVDVLRHAGFAGTVFIPETAPGGQWPDYDAQVRWEHRMLDEATVVSFWVPRHMETMPAMTTNIEYGMFMRTGKLVVGSPANASHMRYWEETCREYRIPYERTLTDTMHAAVIQANAATQSERILSRPVAWLGKYVRVEKTKYLGRRGEVRWYETVRRNTFGDIVSVFALTREREVVLIASYRVPHDAWIIEKPAGLADKRNEHAAELAARELEEETGYCGGTPMELIMRGPFDSGLTDDIMSVYFTRDVVQLKKPRLEGTEDIRTILVPIDQLVDFVQHPPAGTIADMKLLAPLPILQSRGLLT